MKYLLIDFGASYIKTVTYDENTNVYSNHNTIESPFINATEIHKSHLRDILTTLVKLHPECSAAFICTILGGFYDGDIYHSWKSNKTPQKNYCLISGLFNETETFHVHEHHREFTDIDKYSNKLTVLGFINSVPIYSSLGDTFCVINSVDVDDYSVGINLGTGSQIFYKENQRLTTKMYIPSGRTFLMFQNFFDELNLNFFSSIDQLTLDDVTNSTFDIDLNVFPQAHKFSNGGSIKNIMEDTFTVKNLISSILNSYVKQYIDLIPVNKNQIYLLGGMSTKIKILPHIFQMYYPKANVIVCNDGINATHKGIVNFIKKMGE